MPHSVNLTILYSLFIFIVSGLKVSLKNANAISYIKPGAPFGFTDRGETKLYNQIRREKSSNGSITEYVNPESHNSSSIADYRKSDLVPVKFNFQKPKLHHRPIISSLKNDQNVRSTVLESDHFLDGFDDNNADVEIEDDFKINYYLSSKRKRYTRALLDHQFRSSRARKMKDIDSQHVRVERKLFSKEIDSEVTDKSPEKKLPTIEKQTENFATKMIFNSSDSDNVGVVDTPWPLVPGPITCNPDFQLRPSFVAKLREFDYVVSVQLQRNPEQPAVHACTGVIYNPRFVITSLHCLIDNYGLTVTSTDDLCTIDEMIEVDYIIEHENYDSETRRNDIALIKLKSEIHKRAAVFPKNNEILESILYAVGFGELMWKSFPEKISKLLQKVPVRRYSPVLKERPGTFLITTSHMDITGAFRGDFGGALVNSRGEVVGLKAKLANKSTEYEIYTRIQTYLPWINSMVALHGSW